MSNNLLADIDRLISLDKGDVARLRHIQYMVQNNRQLYDSDRRYLDGAIEKYLSTPHIQNTDDDVKSSVDETGGYASDDPTNVQHTKDQETPPEYEKTHKPDLDDTLHDRIDESPRSSSAITPEANSNANNNQNTITANGNNQSSPAWYLLPIFLNIVGGLLSYLLLRNHDYRRARRTLLLGVILFVIPFVGTASLLVVSDDNTVLTTDLSDSEIKGKAVMIPYDSLLSNPEMYRGEIIYYEGRLFQTSNDIFDSHSFLIDLNEPDEGFYTGIIWSNFIADDEVKKAFYDDIRRGVYEGKTFQIWGIYKGMYEYDNLVGGINTVPEVDIQILETADKNDEDPRQGRNP